MIAVDEDLGARRVRLYEHWSLEALRRRSIREISQQLDVDLVCFRMFTGLGQSSRPLE